MRVPFVDLGLQYRSLKRELDAAVQSVLESGSYILGDETQACEREVAAFCGVPHGVGVASGTDALELALRAFGIGPGDEVILPSLTFVATGEAILHVGATPVFVDVEPDFFTLDPAAVAAAVTFRTKAIMPVHLYGHPCDMPAISAIATKHSLVVIEDCAQAIGAALGNQRVGSFGDAGCFSFFPTKNLSIAGDGGMVVTGRADVAQRLKALRNHGSRQKYQHTVLGRNSRLDEIHAAMLRVKLPHLDGWNQKRIQIAARYRELFRQIRDSDQNIHLPQAKHGARHVYHVFALRTARRDDLLAFLREQGIESWIHYPIPLHQQEIFRFLKPHALQVSEQVAREVLSLPIYPEMEEEAIQYVVKAVAQFLSLQVTR